MADPMTQSGQISSSLNASSTKESTYSADVILFSTPPVYDKNKTQIDKYIELIRTRVEVTLAKLQDKLPGALKRTKAE